MLCIVVYVVNPRHEKLDLPLYTDSTWCIRNPSGEAVVWLLQIHAFYLRFHLNSCWTLWLYTVLHSRSCPDFQAES